MILKKYYKKVPEQEIHKELKEKYTNFSDIIIHIDWDKILFNRVSFITTATQKFSKCRYLEIGCDNNICFKSIPVVGKIGVDPDRGGTIKDTSDNFFKNNNNKFDVIFIDGLHLYEQCRRDVINSIKVLDKNGYIFLHDMTPRNWAEENVPRLKNTLWTGDIWKVAIELSKTKGIDFFVINADMGVGVLKKKEDNVVYHNEFEILKDLKFKDFLNLNECINYISPEEGIELIKKN
tara:strand:+ start:620 stop:1324 length:705 start_codon:yes stop_codon:yes gene_type:complete